MTMRVAHATDIHWQLPPSARELCTFKRALGTANLYLRGRRHHFQREVQDALVAHLVDAAPDLVLITGDLTATALRSEFALARERLAPVLDRFPTFVIPGNHDVYTPGAWRERRIEAHFGEFMGEGGPVRRVDVGSVTCLGLDPNRPTWLLASGVLPEDQLDGLRDALADPALADRIVVLCIHYPILDRHGHLYDGVNHGLRNAGALVEVLRQAPVRPALIVHGHEHHGYAVDLDLDGARVPIRNCGSSGYAWMPARGRAAATNIYTLDRAGLRHTERFLYDGERFAPEPGGAYATGR